MKTVLITGTSSGIGKAAVKYFQARGWNVAATMRKPENEKELVNLKNVKCIKLDVEDVKSIRTGIKETIKEFGGIDVIVNNAGYAVSGPFEAVPDEKIKQQFDVNVFGVMNVIREILPYFREQKNGTIINITSIGGLVTFPLYSLYHSTKWAIEGFSESLAYELRSLNIKVKVVEPGVVKTDFYNRSADVVTGEKLSDYNSYFDLTTKNSSKFSVKAPGPEHTAKIIFKAATDQSNRLRYIAGSDGVMILMLRKILPFSLFRFLIRKTVEKA